MPDSHIAPDPVREEALRQAAAAIPAGLPLTARALLPPLFADLPLAELAALPADQAAAMAVSLHALAAQRLPGQACIRVQPAGRFPHPVVEIITDDMPFLVDSVLATITRAGRHPRQVLHPILPVTRDAQGALVAVGQGELRESMMRVALSGAENDAPALEALLAATLSDVRRAVEDFPAMLAELQQAEALAEGEARDFIAWLRADNFVLLGHRRLMAAGAALRAEAGLGLLRGEAPIFDALRDLSAVPPAVRAGLLAGEPISVAKANMRSTVHRPQHADVIAVRIFDAAGAVVGVRLFLGLFAAGAYNRNPRSIPLLATKVERILEAAGVSAFTHDGRALRNILDTWPRDELFQATEAEVLDGVRRALVISLTPRPALVLRPDPFGRFVSAIVWLPRENFDTRLRTRVGEMLARAHGGRLSTFYIALGDGPLARVHYIIATDPASATRPDAAALEALIAEAARSFGERLAEALSAQRGEEDAASLLAIWRDAFPPAYREAETVAQGIADIQLAGDVAVTGRARAMLLRPPGASPREVMIRLASPNSPLALAEALPLFESLDLRAIEEMPYRLTPTLGRQVVLHVYRLEARVDVPEHRLGILTAALHALLAGDVEADGFNRLVLRADIEWKECWLLRAMYRWLKQVGFPFAQASVEEALAAHPEAARLLIALFNTRFDPGAASRDETALDAAWRSMLDAVQNPDEDRILTRLRVVLDAMLRTNFFQAKLYLAFKLDSALAGEMPSPRPWREIFVHSTRMEGTHLRAGPVARGGIRWSDRREDFRTEILGLMKAQRLKNVVIVPTGAKGGFVLKGEVPTERAAFQETGIAAYRTLVRGMLDVTDNLAGGAVVPPPDVVRRDGDDPYIVAAADKGTATFSDIANGLSAEYGFWLGDAFASGGSAGYDHKGMGITARGAWVMVARHFAELGHDIFTQPFTCVGVGDMSGDVFGNGLLISQQTRLIAAFDHRHIFIDPDPDPAVSHAERARLFALPRSSWDDYDRAKISAGGGVFARNQRSIALSPQARARLGIAEERAEPAAIMRAILRAEADLLYFGGIGTYLKAHTESHADAGDRANDAIRVDARDLRVRVVGEGANLGVTQAARIEAAQQGIRINTDALDNSAGVSTSDHEVNIKILLAAAEAQGALTRTQRDMLLAEMTDEVAGLVLRDNHQQSIAISLEVAAGPAAWPAQAALMGRLETAGLLDRALAGLPDDAAIAARGMAQSGITRPEAAALLPFAKLWLKEAVLATDLPDDPAFLPLLRGYFPGPLQARFAGFIEAHPLRRDLVATALSNQVANRLGCAGLGRLTAESEPAAALRAAWLAGAALGLEAAADAADALPRSAEDRLHIMATLRAALEQAARLLLTEAAPIADVLAALTPGVAPLVGGDAGPEALAACAALGAAPAILRLPGPPAEAAAAWDEAARRFHLSALRQAANAAPVAGSFGNRARAALLADLDTVQARLAAALLTGAALPAGAEATAKLAEDAARFPDLAAVTVAARALTALA